MNEIIQEIESDDGDVYTGTHRYMCGCLEELRDIIKHGVDNVRTKKLLNTLIEEIQTHGNRMEAALSYGNDLNRLHKVRSKIKEEIKALTQARKDIIESEKKEL
jgi:hypothetical protein